MKNKKHSACEECSLNSPKMWLCGLEPILVLQYICTHCWGFITQMPVISLRLPNRKTWDGCRSLDHWGKPERRRHVIACTHGAVCATTKKRCVQFWLWNPWCLHWPELWAARLASQRPPINMRIMTTRGRSGVSRGPRTVQAWWAWRAPLNFAQLKGGGGAQIGNWDSTNRVYEEQSFPTEQFIEAFISLNDEKLHLIKQNPHGCFVVVDVEML